MFKYFYHLLLTIVLTLGISDRVSSQIIGIGDNYEKYGDNVIALQTAYPIGSGNIYYRNLYGIFNQINVGINESFSVGGGFELLSFFIDEGAILNFEPKYSFKVRDRYMSVGTIQYYNTGVNEVFGYTYLNYTIGPMNKNITFGLGVSNAIDRFELAASIAINYELSEKFHMMAELVVGDFQGAGISTAWRYKRKSGKAYEIGAIQIFSINERRYTPYLGAYIPISF